MFHDRTDAGNKLAQALSHYDKAKDVIIISLPRGGVVVGAAVAHALHVPHDIAVVRKIGAPGNPEFAIGAVTPTGQPLLDTENIRALGIPRPYLTAMIQQEREIARERLLAYRESKAPLNLIDTTVILVDDGVATGLTLRAVIHDIKQHQPSRIVVALPVAPRETIEEITKEVDEVVCLNTPSPFGAVGMWYEEFPQVTDKEVIALL